MIKVEPCRGCGRTLINHPVANLTARLDAEPLDAQAATRALLRGRTLWRITHTSIQGVRPTELAALRTAEPGERPYVVEEHACTAAGAPRTPSKALGGVGDPKGREADVQSLVVPFTPSSARPTERSGARGAASRTSDTRCSACRAKLDREDVETYVIMELGATVVDAFHSGGCP